MATSEHIAMTHCDKNRLVCSIAQAAAWLVTLLTG